MANENVGKFEELLKGDEGLQAKLQELAKAFAGDLNDDKAIFEATIGKLASEAGLPFTYDEGIAFASSGRELSDDDLEAVAGGGGFCYGIGGSDEVEKDCQHASESVGHACAYVGLSIG